MLRFVTKWLLGMKERKAEVERCKWDTSRMAEVGNRMMVLAERRARMTPKAIIDELYVMHDVYEMPIYWFTGNHENVLYPLLVFLGEHADLTAGDAVRLARMLLWPEVQRYVSDASCRLAILDICERFPTDEVKELIRQHVPFAEDQLEREEQGYLRDHWYGTDFVHTKPAGGVGTHLYDDLSDEVFRARQLVGI